MSPLFFALLFSDCRELSAVNSELLQSIQELGSKLLECGNLPKMERQKMLENLFSDREDRLSRYRREAKALESKFRDLQNSCGNIFYFVFDSIRLKRFWVVSLLFFLTSFNSNLSCYFDFYFYAFPILTIFSTLLLFLFWWPRIWIIGCRQIRW